MKCGWALVAMLSLGWPALSACSRAESKGAPSHASSASTRGVLPSREVASASMPTLARAGPEPSSAAPVGSRVPAEERTWVYESTAVGRMNVVVLIPEHAAGEKLPVLMTMHGRGEALKGPERGARGWVDDYELQRVIERLAHPPLVREDFKQFVKEPRRSRLNAALKDKPYRGLIIVCPYTPDMLTGDDPFGKAPPLAHFLVDELLPRVYRETPALGTPATTAIDGVSLGGRAAFSVGLLRPRAFGVISGLQAAFHSDKAGEIAQRARRARVDNPGLVFRLLTSDEDFFLSADTAIAESMRAAGVPVQFDVVVGPHDYDFNRGPGAIEMLLFEDRALRGEPAP